MNANVAGSCHGLRPGDAVEVFQRSRLVHRGAITEIVPELGQLWILDTLSGGRHLLDIAELEIVRLPPRYREVLTR